MLLLESRAAVTRRQKVFGTLCINKVHRFSVERAIAVSHILNQYHTGQPLLIVGLASTILVGDLTGLNRLILMMVQTDV